MITWKVNLANKEIEGFYKNGFLIYYTIDFSWKEIECTVWSENYPFNTNRFIAVFKEKKGTRKPLL